MQDCKHAITSLAMENGGPFPSNLVTKAFAAFNMAAAGNSWTRLPKYSENHGVLCQVKHEKETFIKSFDLKFNTISVNFKCIKSF